MGAAEDQRIGVVVKNILQRLPEYDLGLRGIGLPGFDGYELARRARRTLGDSLLLIAMTGYGQAEDSRRAFEAGFDDHITKPVSLEKIVGALNRGHAPETASP